MMRSSLIVVSALAAFAAQAQEGKRTEPDTARPTSAPERVEHPVLVASRTNPPATADTRTTAPASGGSSKSQAEGPQGEPADCSVVERYLNGADLAFRTYERPRAAPALGWTRAPFVSAVARCGRLYILQVQSQSLAPWVVRQARVTAPGGVVLQVQALRSSEVKDQRSINVIVAKAPPGTKLSTFQLDLSGEDGRVAQAEAGDLP